MKKYLITLCLIISMTFYGHLLYAQNISYQDSVQHRLDSLENVVKALSSSVQKTQKKEKDHSVWSRKRFTAIGYATQTLTPAYGNELKSDFGVTLTSGRAVYLHKKPLFGKLKFAFNWGSDISYTKYKNYKEEYNYSAADEMEIQDYGLHQCDIGILVGPSITFNPVGHLMISGYFRFVPSYSMLILNDDINSNYASFFTYGGEISWKAIGIGVEGRQGSAKYSSLMSEGDDIKMKYTTHSLRAYISLHF